jgi:hypothetical protein
MEWECTQKIYEGSKVFRTFLRPIPNLITCTSSPADREPRCYPVGSVKKTKSNGGRYQCKQCKRGGQDVGRRLTLLSSLNVVMHSSYQRRRHGKADGKKKVMGKERRSKWLRLWRVETYSIFKSRQFPLSSHTNLIVRKIQARLLPVIGDRIFDQTFFFHRWDAKGMYSVAGRRQKAK